MIGTDFPRNCEESFNIRYINLALIIQDGIKIKAHARDWLIIAIEYIVKYKASTTSILPAIKYSKNFANLRFKNYATSFERIFEFQIFYETALLQ